MADHEIETFLRTLVPGQDPNLDIVAIHGLNPKNKPNYAEKAWESDGKLWLRDFLPKQLPQARIFLYGYNSNVGFQTSAAGVREQAKNLLIRLYLERKGCDKRPILFIAHSLGGIVVKEALVQAKLGEVYSSICTATFGIAFFGTPHQGSSLAGIGDVFARVVRAVLRNPSNTFMSALKKDDPYAGQLLSSFQQLQENYRYLNFYETRPLKSFGIIVEEKSAILGLPDSRETKVALNAHHEAICQFSSEDSYTYKHVSGLIVDLVQSAMAAPKNDIERVPSIVESFNSLNTTLVDKDWVEVDEPGYFMIPYTRNQEFVNRRPAIEKLRSRLQSIGKSHSRVAIFGLGGVGKSQIAIEMAHQVHTESPHVSVFWVHASSIDRFRDGCHDIVDKCNIPGRDNEKSDKILLLKEWLEKEHKNWLLVIDNADDASLFTSKAELSRSKSKTETGKSILEYLPDSPHGSIMITTRDRAAGVKFTRSRADDLVEINLMTPEEADSLIRAALTSDSSTDVEILQLAGLLGHLPLALAQAAAFMHENMITASEYIELYNESDETQMDLLSESFETLGRDSEVPNAVTTTFIVSINQIKEQDPKAIDILCLVAFVDQHDIPKSLIQGKVKRQLDLIKSLGTLKSFSLVSANQQGNFSLHRLVQLVMRKWLIIEGKFLDQALQAMDIAAELFPNAKFEQWSLCAAYLPHAQSILRFLPDLYGKDLRRRLYLQEGIAYYLWTQGYYDEAEILDLLIVEENKKEYGIEHPETLESIAGLAATYESHGKWSEAAGLDQLVTDTRARTLGPTHDLTLNSKLCLAKLLGKQGQLTEAEGLMMEVLETRKLHLGVDHESTVDAMSILGVNCIDMGQLDKAEELTKNVWDWRRKKYGLEHELTLDTASTLGVIYLNQDKPQEAEQLILQTVAAQETKLGLKHPSTLTSKSNLVSIYSDMEEWTKAEELALHVIEEHSKRVGATHFDTLTIRQKLVDIYMQKGLVEQAGTLENQLLEDSIRSLGQDHPFTLGCMQDTALTRKRQERDQEAIQLMTQVINSREKALGPYHDDTLEAFKTLCNWCGNDEAIRILLEAEEK